MRGLQINAKELNEKFPCQIQLERLHQLGKFRGQTVIVENDEKIGLSNVFTTSAYRKEICAVLETQRKFHAQISDAFCDAYLEIFNRKRKYYDGPGNEQSRTDYGKYTTKVDENGNFITDKNIFEKLKGKDMMRWIGLMNNIRACADEIVMNDIVYS